MASAAYGVSVGTTSHRYFDAENDGGKCTKIGINVRTLSAAPVLVNIPGLHESGEWFEVQAGQFVEFRLNHSGIAALYMRTASGTATVSYGVTSKTLGGD